MPYPTPLLSEDGELLGAVNILIDITEQRQAGELRAQAVRCRRLAAAVGDAQAGDTLERMAKEYDAKAVALDHAASPPADTQDIPHRRSRLCGQSGARFIHAAFRRRLSA